MEALHLKLALFLLFLNLVLTQQVPLSSNLEWSALLHLRSSLSIISKSWPKKTDPCSNWTGIDCHNGRVISINLSGLTRTRIGRLNPQFSVDSLVNFTMLVSFNSSGFSLPGSIPGWFGETLISLQVLDLRSSSIFGPIPPSLGYLTTLNSLYLSNNFLTGMIPSTLGNSISLSVVDLSHNLLTGSIPNIFSGLSNLSTLDLSFNFLSGSIPSGFGSLGSLKILKLCNNSLSGSFPDHLTNLSKLVELDLGYNYFSGSLPGDLGGLRSLQKMFVGNNGLEGTLPDALWAMPQLQVLDVSGNNLTGVFVFMNYTADFNASGKEFNFSNNQFYGNLSFVVGIFFSIDLSSNYFEGVATNNISSNVIVARNCFRGVLNQRSLEECRGFYSDRGLSFGNDRDSESMQPPLQESPRSKKRLAYVMVGVFGGLGFIVILVVALVLILKTRDNRNENAIGTANLGPIPQGDGTTPPKVSISVSGLGESFTYQQMLKATSEFSDVNLIRHGHSGDLFRGILEDGFPVVIKRIDLRSSRQESYVLELDAFSKVTHSRFVPLLGHCLENEDEKLLVYKYMTNKDLSNCFYRFTNSEDDDLQSLDWITRLKIAIGAAEGLCYLHHECNPPLVHRDIQASSILLDDKYEVRIGSLSEIHAQGVDNHQNAVTRLLWKLQSIEQGSSEQSSTNCAYDVYCFGKVLLELVTGKIGISKSDDASTKEWLEHNLPFISINDKELVAKIVDQSLVINEDLLEEVLAVAIVAKSCLHPKPSRRPLMRHIVGALENPFKVVREETFSSAMLRTSSTRSWTWSSAFFGSWRQSSSGSSSVPCQTNKEGTSGVKQGNGANTHSSSHKRSSSEIFPEPVEVQDIEKR